MYNRSASASVIALRRRRHALYRLTQARVALEAAGIPVPDDMVRAENTLARSTVFVAVDCVLCRQPHPVEAKVGDSGEPSGVRCEECDRLAMAAVNA